MLFKKHLIIFSSIFLASCSAINLYTDDVTQIFLFSRGVSQDESEKIAHLLEESGFNVSISALVSPPQIDSHTIIYSALMQDYTLIESLENILASQGYEDFYVTIGSYANHAYTQNDLGLYLIKNQPLATKPAVISADEPDKVDLPNYFDGRCPDYDAVLNLYGEGVFLIEKLIWDDATEIQTPVYETGTWETLEQTVMLTLDDKDTVIFSIEDFEITYERGMAKGIELIDTSDGNIFEGCKFIASTYYR